MYHIVVYTSAAYVVLIVQTFYLSACWVFLPYLGVFTFRTCCKILICLVCIVVVILCVFAV